MVFLSWFGVMAVLGERVWCWSVVRVVLSDFLIFDFLDFLEEMG